MKADGIWGNIFRLGERNQSLGQILQNIPIFHELTPKELKILERVVHTRTYQPAETVFLEDEPGAGMYVIRSGRIDIVLKHETQNPMLLAELEPGDFFGEMALLGDSARSATAAATCTTATCACCFKRITWAPTSRTLCDASTSHASWSRL